MEAIRTKVPSKPVSSFGIPPLESAKVTPAYVPAMPFGAANYQLMIAGIVTILAGFFIMTLDTEPFGFGFLGLTLGPIVVTAGFVVEFFAILKKPATSDKMS